jgi:hypothetical protein
MDKVYKPSDSECYAPSPEPFGFLKLSNIGSMPFRDSVRSILRPSKGNKNYNMFGCF